MADEEQSSIQEPEEDDGTETNGDEQAPEDIEQ